MRKLILSVNFSALLAVAAEAQDLGTPVITPPILSEPASAGQQLIVPPSAPPSSPATPASPARQPSAGGTPMSDAGAADGALSRTSSTQTFSDWTLECFEPAFSDGACQITHRVISGNANQVVMVFALSAREDGPAYIQMALPLGISLPGGIGLAIGNGYQSHVAIQRCTPQGCIVEGTGSDDLLAAMKREASGLIVVKNDQNQEINLPFSLKGFTAAYDAMIKHTS